MKPNRFERSYRDTIPLEGVTTKSLSNSIPMSRSAGKISMSCDHCGMTYETYACWAKRVARHYCSKACANAGKETPIEKTCAVCGETFITTPAAAWKFSTCSKKCMTVKRRQFLLAEAKNMGSSSVYNYGKHERGGQISKKLNDDVIREIINDPRPQAEIGKDYGICQSHVSQIKRRVIWGHVTDKPPNVLAQGRETLCGEASLWSGGLGAAT